MPACVGYSAHIPFAKYLFNVVLILLQAGVQFYIDSAKAYHSLMSICMSFKSLMPVCK